MPAFARRTRRAGRRRRRRYSGVTRCGICVAATGSDSGAGAGVEAGAGWTPRRAGRSTAACPSAAARAPARHISKTRGGSAGVSAGGARSAGGAANPAAKPVGAGSGVAASAGVASAGAASAGAADSAGAGGISASVGGAGAGCPNVTKPVSATGWSAPAAPGRPATAPASAKPTTAWIDGVDSDGGGGNIGGAADGPVSDVRAPGERANPPRPRRRRWCRGTAQGSAAWRRRSAPRPSTSRASRRQRGPSRLSRISSKSSHASLAFCAGATRVP